MLEKNKIGNEGLTALARALADGAAPKLKLELKELVLDGNDFSGADEELRLLGQAKLPALKTLQLNQCNFNLAALAEGMQEGAWPSLEDAVDEEQQAGERRGGGGARPRARARRHAQAEEDLCQGGGMSEAGKAAVVKAGRASSNESNRSTAVGSGRYARRWQDFVICVVMRSKRKSGIGVFFERSEDEG